MEKIEEIEKDMTPNLIGKTFRKYPTEKSKQKATYGLFQCQYCEGTFESITQSVRCGDTKSCGCLRGEMYGLHSHRFYNTWRGMIERCNSITNISYKNYGGRGITVCEEWLDIRNFVAWAESTHPNLEGYTLDRLENELGYSPENCTWSDRVTQNINQRIQKNNTSGCAGISWIKKNKKWRVVFGYNNARIYLGYFEVLEEAVRARDNYIIEHNLPHKLSTQY